MIDLGVVKPGSTIRIPFSSFDKDDGSSITMTNYAAADILIYKNGSTTERASTAGFTATTDFDSKTGKHLAIIDLADNTTADFYNAGAEYLVAIDAVTVDAITTGGWIARFTIGYTDAHINTTIATLTSQTSFTLTVGPAEDDALNGCVVIIHDIASSVQLGYAVVSDYTGSTKTVTLTAGVTFTAAAGDNISVFPPGNARWFAGLLASALPLTPTTAGRTLDVSAGGEAGVDWANVGSPTTAVDLSGTNIKTDQKVDVNTIKTNPVVNAGTVTFPTTATLASTTNITAGTITTATNVTTVNGLAAGVITAAAIADSAIDAATFAADVDAEARGWIGMASANLDTQIGTLATAAALDTVDNFLDTEVAAILAAVDTEVAAILADTNELQTDWVDGGRLDLILDARASQTSVNTVDDFLDTEIADIQARLPAALTAGGNMKSDALAISGSTESADRLERSTLGIVTGTCAAAGTTTAVIASALSPASVANDQFNGRIITFDKDTTTTSLRGQSTDITDYVHATLTFTVTALTTAPASGDTFVIT